MLICTRYASIGPIYTHSLLAVKLCVYNAVSKQCHTYIFTHIRMYIHTYMHTYVTRNDKIGLMCAQNLITFLDFKIE